MKNIFRTCLALLLLSSFLLPTVSVAQSAVPAEIDSSRNKLIGYMLSKQLPVMHFSDKVMNDDLAFAAFEQE